MTYAYSPESGFPLPSDTKGHRNGELPDRLLRTLHAPGKGRLIEVAFRSYSAMQAAHLKETGKRLGTTSSADAYRSRANQVAAFLRRYRPVYNPVTCTLADGRLGPDGKRWFKLKGVAALAGFDKNGNVRSLHGWGIAADLNPVNTPWLERRAAAFGWKKSSPKEPWHWFHVTGDRLTSAVLAYERTGESAPPPEPKPQDRPVLRLGDSGPAVRIVQKAVGATVDGEFGPRTQRKVMEFQRDHGLVPDGIVGPKTWAAIT